MELKRNLILHLPHASLHIPDYANFLISREAVDAEALYLADLYTDELFLPELGDSVVKAQFSRIYCDVERFIKDELEPMSQFGMGSTYLRCDDGSELRFLTIEQRNEILSRFYEPHHLKLTMDVDKLLLKSGEARIVDCHSFPDTPFRCSLYKGNAKYDFNIGTDSFHTPQQWIDASIAFFANLGFRLGIDEPYDGCMVPLKHYKKNRKVKSIMLEVNRQLYISENYCRGPRFNEIQEIVTSFISIIRNNDF